MDQRWFEDIMSQTFNEDICFNPSKLLLLQFIAKGETIQKTYNRIEFQEYLYRVYIDNPDIASKHPNYIIRNLGRYGTKDLYEHVSDIFESWVRDSKNGVLRSSEHYFWLQVDLDDATDIAKNTNRLCKMLYKKLFRGEIPDAKSITEILEQDDTDVDIFGKGLFRNRILEDIQYCPICEDINLSNLHCVHILEKRMGATNEELTNKANGLLFCKKHAEDFIKRKFCIDEMGFARDLNGSDIEPGMHLSFSVRNAERKQFLKKRNEFMQSCK